MPTASSPLPSRASKNADRQRRDRQRRQEEAAVLEEAACFLLARLPAAERTAFEETALGQRLSKALHQRARRRGRALDQPFSDDNG